MGNRPLYKGFPASNSRPQGGNTGLWYDKFCDKWERDWKLGAPAKLEWIKTVAGRLIGDEALLKEMVARREHLVRAQGGESKLFVTDGRLVSGLGRSHPVENGFAWHHTLGVPYLPGSSVKGMVHAWAVAENAAEVERIFGSPKQGAGTVCLLDAIPTAPVKLEADVITPHYAGWSPSDPPGDWRSPTPIPFLVTASETPFLFSVVPTPRAEKGDVDKALAWLNDALAFAGAGAKTAVGYGRFKTGR